MPPLVSVCMPVYNGAKYLNEAIESIQAQTLSDFELIICDDASTDNSVEIIDRYGQQDKRIRWSSNSTNLGLFANYNACLKLAKAPVVKPFAQDDILHANMLNVVHDVLTNFSDVALVSVKRRWINESGAAINLEGMVNSASKYFPVNTPVSADEVIKASLLYIDNFIGEPCTVAFRSNLVGDGFNTKFHQLGDLEYWLRIINGGQYYFVDQELCDFRFHAASTSTANARHMLHAVDTIRLMKLFQNRLPLHGQTEAEFLQKATTILASHIANFVDNNQLSLETVRQMETLVPTASGKWDESDFQIFRELTFHALNALGRAKSPEKSSSISPPISANVSVDSKSTAFTRLTAWLDKVGKP